MSVTFLGREGHFKFEEGITAQSSFERLKYSELFLALSENPIFMTRISMVLINVRQL